MQFPLSCKAKQCHPLVSIKPAKRMTGVNAGFCDLSFSFESIPPDVQTNSKFNNAQDEIKHMQPTN
jgi:hypothetical protein